MESGSNKLSSVEAVIVGFTAATTFLLGFGYWQLTTRQNELETKLEEQRRRSDTALVQFERELEANWAADLVELQVLLQKLRERSLETPSKAPIGANPEVEAARDWLVLLATVPGDDLGAAEMVADSKLQVARSRGIASPVSIYRTKIRKRLVVGLGGPRDKGAAVALAAEARRTNLAADAFAEHATGWERVGMAPFAMDASTSAAR